MANRHRQPLSRCNLSPLEENLDTKQAKAYEQKKVQRIQEEGFQEIAEINQIQADKVARLKARLQQLQILREKAPQEEEKAATPKRSESSSPKQLEATTPKQRETSERAQLIERIKIIQEFIIKQQQAQASADQTEPETNGMYRPSDPASQNDMERRRLLDRLRKALKQAMKIVQTRLDESTDISTSTRDFTSEAESKPKPVTYASQVPTDSTSSTSSEVTPGATKERSLEPKGSPKGTKTPKSDTTTPTKISEKPKDESKMEKLADGQEGSTTIVSKARNRPDEDESKPKPVASIISNQAANGPTSSNSPKVTPGTTKKLKVKPKRSPKETKKKKPKSDTTTSTKLSGISKEESSAEKLAATVPTTAGAIPNSAVDKKSRLYLGMNASVTRAPRIDSEASK